MVNVFIDIRDGPLVDFEKLDKGGFDGKGNQEENNEIRDTVDQT